MDMNAPGVTGTPTIAEAKEVCRRQLWIERRRGHVGDGVPVGTTPLFRDMSAKYPAITLAAMAELLDEEPEVTTQDLSDPYEAAEVEE